MNEWMDEFFWWKAYLSLEGTSYANLSDLADALRTGKTGAILLDLFVHMKRKDLFNHTTTWYTVTEVINQKLTHGIELRGVSIKLAKKLENFILDRNLEINFLEDKNEKDEKDEKDENEEENEASTVRDAKLLSILI